MNGKRKTELDTIGRELFERAGLETESIDRIAASPDSYRSVLKRITESRSLELSADIPRWNRFGMRHLAATAMTLVVVSFISFSSLRHDEAEDAAFEIELPAIKPETARPETPNGVIESERPIRRGKNPDTVTESISALKPQTRQSSTARNEASPKAEFVSLGLSSSPQQTADGGRVIRVELPAASLFAMGVNVPIENGSGMFKADLIVGPDGVTRAVKLVE